MPRKGMRSVFFKPSYPSLPSTSASTLPSSSSSPLRTFSDSLMEEDIEIAHSLVTKWDSDHSNSYARITSLFNVDRREAKRYLHAVRGLQSAMQYLVSQDSTSKKLVQAQSIMQLAMKRLEQEFHHILAANRDHLDPESVSGRSSVSGSRASFSDFDEELLSSEDEFRVAGDSISEMERVSMLAVADLKAIADCMISSGYGKECINIYKNVRKSIVDEALFHLGVEKLSLSQVQKMDWEVLELKIKSWLKAINVAVRTLFYGEKILCNNVFPTSEKVTQSCFAEICRDGAMLLFGFPEIVAKCKKNPERMFRILDLYEAINDHLPQIESTFSFESTSAVRSQAITSLDKLGKSIRTMFADFESAIQKESSKKPVPGGGVHPLTPYVMKYITFLAGYSRVLGDLVADWPLPVQFPLPESYFPSPKHDDRQPSEISVRLAWLILVLLCKLDVKAELYKDVALSYLFLANNLLYVVVKVRTSNLRVHLGEEWLTRHETKVKEYVSKYEQLAWRKVWSSLPENHAAELTPGKARAYFKSFNVTFHEAYRKQTSWIVSDPKLREEIKASIASKLVEWYGGFYEKHRVGLKADSGSDTIVRFSPDDLGNYISDILQGMGVSGSVSSQSSSSSRRSNRS